MGTSLRVVTYNVHSLRDDLGALASVVRGLDPDVAIIQEAPRRWRWRMKCSLLAHSFGLYYAAGGQPSLGNVIMTSMRVHVDSTWCMRYPLTPGRHMRGVAFARCSVPGADPFVVAGTHLSTYDTERPAQATFLLPALAACADPVILGVDVNETDDGPSWKLLAAGLTDAGAESTVPTFGERRIDTLFVDPRITVDRCFVADSPIARRASDHLPVVADLKLA